VHVQDVKIVRQSGQFAHQVVSFGQQCLELGAAVADFDHGHAETLPVQKFLFGLFQHGQWQHGRTGPEIEYAFHSSFLVCKLINR